MEEHLYSNTYLRRLLMPLIIEQILSSLMGTVDTMMVTRIGSAAVSGVSLVDTINKLVIFLFTALATGGTILMSQYIGRKDRHCCAETARQLLLAALGSALLLSCACLACFRPLLRLVFGTVEEAAMRSAQDYFFITIFTYPFVALFNAGSAIYRANGKTKLPMLISLVCNCLNIVGNALFLFVLHMGVRGAALATLIGNILSAAAMLAQLYTRRSPVQLGSLRTLRPNLTLIKSILRVGLPTGIENSMFQFGKIVVQSTVSTLGTTAITANALVVVIELFTSMPSQAIGIGLVTVAGQCVGAGRIDEARYYTKKLTVWGAAALLVTNWLLFALTRPITVLAGTEQAAADLAVQVMLVISIVKPVLWPLSFLPCNGTRAAGDVRFNMLVASGTMWICRVGLTTVLCRCLGCGLIGVWSGYFLDWGVRSIIFALRFRGDKWYRKKLID